MRLLTAIATLAILGILTLMLLLALFGPGRAHAEPLDPPREPDLAHSWPQPHYLPSWERTQRRYLPSYQYELERRKICGDYCDDLSRRRSSKSRKRSSHERGNTANRTTA